MPYLTLADPVAKVKGDKGDSAASSPAPPADRKSGGVVGVVGGVGVEEVKKEDVPAVAETTSEVRGRGQ